MDISIEKLKHTSVAKQEIEIVERKGVGHPDSLTDGICEAASRILCKYYMKKKGFVLHHKEGNILPTHLQIRHYNQ